MTASRARKFIALWVGQLGLYSFVVVSCAFQSSSGRHDNKADVSPAVRCGHDTYRSILAAWVRFLFMVTGSIEVRVHQAELFWSWAICNPEELGAGGVPSSLLPSVF
ncbi:uncharacterized protein STEHIDRAFT_123614 [Stereum hirsutum FP-91666 SS1]|uniref:uncharacterized protein n=1 Tax=Stereum hirsutum (strain FP-91666) TaxID=721885 RepID=UPI000444A0B6|nr:uncharacterized protein STEHIDRAFT_123614 [Stereum hirsutum FP-91666 SS1]EIM84121.1 hypothetical protein STEHIDRAFT_123614 [Stereum hirsutum FP-91666 SS1]